MRTASLETICAFVASALMCIAISGIAAAPNSGNKGSANQTKEPLRAGASRPNCPAGWTDFSNPLIGMKAHVPTNYWVRLRGGTLLTVEKVDSPATMAFMLPFRPRANAKPAEIAEHFSKFIAETEPRFKAQLVGTPTSDRAVSKFTSFSENQTVEGRYCTLLAAGGTMAFVIGYLSPTSQLDAERSTLMAIAQGFGFEPPRGRWLAYQSPAGGFTMDIPQGWAVQSSDGQTSKDDIDWVARSPERPFSRAFQSCPRYCSPQLLQDPLHVIRGYRAAQFSTHQQAVVASLEQLSQDVKILKWGVNQPLTDLFRRLNQQLAQIFTAMNLGQADITVYDCLAQVNLEGTTVLVAFVAGIQTLSINGGFSGQLTDLRVTLRGWCAEPRHFVSDSPVLEKICASMQLSPAFLRRISQGNEQAASKIRETYAYMNKVDDQIRQSRWDTMGAIAEMNYDNLRDYGGYVNEQTGRIEQIAPDKLVKNSHGEYVSREEIERGISPENATVLRGAYSADYMRGVYGRIEF
jgi:hypothetical protein